MAAGFIAPPTLSGGATLMATADAGSLAGTYREFNRETDFTIGEGNKQRSYESGTSKKTKRAVKWGQLKLLVEEVQFFTLYWDPAAVPTPHVVYVGSAEGTHISVLANMFPSFTWHLFDARKHDPILSEFKQININERYFTGEDVKRFSGRSDVFFISDIRTLTYQRQERIDEKTQRENEATVIRDMDLQASWVEAIKPVRASLKFRLPYTWKWFTDENPPTRDYLDGLVYLQQWGPITTTETRLVPHKDLAKRSWDYRAHEEMLFYHNTRVREQLSFINPFTGKKEPISVELGLLDDYDSVATVMIARDYLTKIGVEPNKDNTLALVAGWIMGANKGKTTLIGVRSGIVKNLVVDDEDD